MNRFQIDFLLLSSHNDHSTHTSSVYFRTSGFLIFFVFNSRMCWSCKYPRAQRDEEAMNRYFVTEPNMYDYDLSLSISFAFVFV